MEKAIMREQREEAILLSLKKLGYLNRSQIQQMHQLGGERNTRRVLKEMAEYLGSFRDGQTVYYLNKEGRERVNCTKVYKKTIQARHFLMRNDLYIAFNQPSTWKNEMKLEIPNKVRIIADALFKIGDRYHIVEVDHTQKMSKNRIKMEKYRTLMQSNVFKVPPKFVWITTTEFKQKQLEKLCEGLDYQVFTAKSFH